MRISRILVPPITVDLDEQQWQVPCYSLTQYTELGAYIDSKMLNEATKGMGEQQRFQHLAFYGIMPMSLPAIRRFSLTPEGISRVLHEALAKARVVGVRDSVNKPFHKLDAPRAIESEVMEGFIEFGEHEEKEALVRLIMRIPVEPPAATAAAGAEAKGDDKGDQQEGEGKSPDPTKAGSSPPKNVGLATGTSSSASSERRTPAPTR